MNYIEEKARMIKERGARDRAARGSGGSWAVLRVIPLPAWIVAVLVYTGMLLLLALVILPHDPKARMWSPWQQVPFETLIPLFLFVWVLLIGYVNGDAKRRGMRRVMWTLLAIFIPNAIGVILYFLLRDPLPSPCPNCAAMVGGTYSFCPHCGTVLAPACPHCRRSIDRTWANCAYCGMKLGATAEPAA